MTPITDRGTERWTLTAYVDIARRRKWYIVVCIVLCGGAALGYSLMESPRYEASAVVLVRPQSSVQVYGEQSVNAVRALANEVFIVESETTADKVEERLGARYKIGAVPSDDADAITLNARASDPETAAAVANAFADVYLETRAQESVTNALSAAAEIQVRLDKVNVDLAALSQPLELLKLQIDQAIDPVLRRQLEDQYSQKDAQTDAQRQELSKQQAFLREQLDRIQVNTKISSGQNALVLQRATPPSSPVAPRPTRDFLFGLLAGAVLGGAAALIRDQFDDTIRNESDLHRSWPEIPVLASIPKLPKGVQATDDLLNNPATRVHGEQFRALRTAVGFITLTEDAPIIQVTSAVASEGKTTISAHLIASLGEAGAHTLGVCCDLRRPKLHEYFRLDPRVGFTNLVLGEASPNEVLQQPDGYPTVSILPAGTIPPNPSELLSQRSTVESLLGLMGTRFSAVVIDSAPVLPVADASIVASFSTITILVVRAGISHRHVERALEQLRRTHVRVVGFVLNATTPPNNGDSYYTDYYYSSSVPDKHQFTAR